MSALLVILLVTDTIMAFLLSVYSIHAQYMGALPCFTAIVAPLNVGISWVLNQSVKKSESENTGPNNEGIQYQRYIDSITKEEPTI